MAKILDRKLTLAERDELWILQIKSERRRVPIQLRLLSFWPGDPASVRDVFGGDYHEHIEEAYLRGKTEPRGVMRNLYKGDSG